MRADIVNPARTRVPLLIVAAAFALAGCASRGDTGAGDGPGAYGAESAEAAIGNFLEAARLGDYAAMARMFGTTDGPAERRWGWGETEQRMFVLASLIAPRAWELRTNPVSAGYGTSRWIVDLAGTRNGDVSVPFIVAAHGNRWFVERVATEGLSVP